MTIAESLLAENSYPINDLVIEKICLIRELIPTDTFTKGVGDSQAYELAYADLLVWLHNAPSLVEQAVGVNNAIAIKQNMLTRANKIYAKYEDAGFSGFKYGMIGENWNA